LLSTNQYGLNVLLLRLEDWQKAGKDSGPPGNHNVQRSADELIMALKSVTARRSVPWLVCICPPSDKIQPD